MAGRLAKEAWQARGGGKRKFSAPIHYPKLGICLTVRGRRHSVPLSYDDPGAMIEWFASSPTRVSARVTSQILIGQLTLS
jgi:hypothetical protein